MGGRATTVLPLMWVFVAIVFVFIGLRLYTRLRIVDQLGADDHIYTMSGFYVRDQVFLLFYVLFLQISAAYGFGQSITTLSADHAATAIKWEMVGQTFAILGMAIAKWSLGLFLLRIVIQRWQRVAIWSTMVSLLLVSIITAIIFWIQCLPPASIYDQRVEGRCIVKITPFSIVLGAWCIFADFFFALLPWLFIWSLNMSRLEKVTIAGSLSLGIIAGACGIVRTMELQGFNSNNYTEATVGLIVWSAAELAITMVCIGIPVLRPLFSHWLLALRGPSQDVYDMYGESRDGPVFTMHTIGGRVMKGGGRSARGSTDAPTGLSIQVPTTKTQISTYNTYGSAEQILGSVDSRSAEADQGLAIHVREDDKC
ncbi:hypothetical protein VPNG_06517 [Cytospora leucostoma]|uniref:Rhodopsin domain-containing protein n=1 Tax=Cytospora leucostoma TaxID=1230097 RepID=A0A423X2C3_9PEZI|nr:hypothetical protein VPNG_06517 [Cytospora leucostoma]